MSASEVETNEADDARLMTRIASRDAAALRALYERYSPTVFAICLRIIRDRDEAEQLLIDVFAELWDRADRFDVTRGSVKAYLALLARSRSIDHARKSPQVASRSLEGLADTSAAQPVAPGSDGGSIDAERRAVVDAALASLSAEQRDAIQLAFYAGLSHPEVAARLNRPLGTVKTQIRAGLARLRDGLSHYWQGGAER